MTSGSGDLLLDSAQDIQVAGALSTAGDVGLVAGRDVLIQTDVNTPANVLIDAGRNVIMDSLTAIRATDNIVVRATGSLELALLQARTSASMWVEISMTLTQPRPTCRRRI